MLSLVSSLRGRGRSVSTIAVLALVAVGCSSNEFQDRTAVVEVGEQRIEFEVDQCGLDGTNAFVVGRAKGGLVLQAVVGVEADDLEAGVPASTGVTVLDDDGEQGAFGAEAWRRRGGTGPAPGRVVDARVRGARIQASGGMVPLDEQGNAIPNGTAVPFTFDARCDEATP